MFRSTSPLLILDHFRVPYEQAREAEETPSSVPSEVRSFERVSKLGRDAAVLWPRFVEARCEGPWRLGKSTLWGQLLPDNASEKWLYARSRRWRPAVQLENSTRAPVSSIWVDDAGSVFLPFDPDDVMLTLWSERYHLGDSRGGGPGSRRNLVRAYYRLRPLIPRAAQIWMRRQYAHVQSRRAFPAWPIEESLHSFCKFVLGLFADLAEEPVPAIGAWPRGFDWAFVLTHDVETAVGYARVEGICDLETRLGYRSSWNFVPRRYRVSNELVQRLGNSGFEVGLHGLYHDGRDLESLSRLNERLPAMREYADAWGAVGFRSPATQRNWEWMPLLGFDYDSSYPDVDPFEPQPGGCCSWLPFFNRDLVELPMTLPQDHTLFVILGQSNQDVWVHKIELLKARGGMALINTHPDYFHHKALAEAYAAVLELYGSDARAWKVLPREVSSWWRERAASRLCRVDGLWQVEGPLKGRAVIELIAPGETFERQAA